MANKYKFGRDCITVNGRQFPARYEVMEQDADRGSYYTVVIYATVEGGAEVTIEVPASDRQHGAALKAAQMAAGLLDMDSGSAAQIAPDGAQDVQQAQAADPAQDVQQMQTAAAADAAQIAPDGAQIEKEAQTMKSNIKRYAVYFSDYPRQAMTVEAANKRDAEKAGRQYIKAWNLTAKIDRVERIVGDAAPARQDVQQAPTAAAAAQDVQQAPTAADAAQDVQQAPTAADAAQIAPAALEELPGRAAARRQQARRGRQQAAAAPEGGQAPAPAQAAQAPEAGANRAVSAPDAAPAPAAEAVVNVGNNDTIDSAPDAAQIVPDAPPAQAPAAPEEPSPDVLEEIGGAAPARQDVQRAQAPAAAPAQAIDPKAAHGPIPEKTFINEVIAGKGWSIVFDAGCNKTRVILANPIKAAARPIVEAAGFYYSRALDSWNKKLTFRAYRAAQALAEKLRAAL